MPLKNAAHCRPEALCSRRSSRHCEELLGWTIGRKSEAILALAVAYAAPFKASIAAELTHSVSRPVTQFRVISLGIFILLTRLYTSKSRSNGLSAKLGRLCPSVLINPLTEGPSSAPACRNLHRFNGPSETALAILFSRHHGLNDGLDAV